MRASTVTAQSYQSGISILYYLIAAGLVRANDCIQTAFPNLPREQMMPAFTLFPRPVGAIVHILTTYVGLMKKNAKSKADYRLFLNR